MAGRPHSKSHSVTLRVIVVDFVTVSQSVSRVYTVLHWIVPRAHPHCIVQPLWRFVPIFESLHVKISSCNHSTPRIYCSAVRETVSLRMCACADISLPSLPSPFYSPIVKSPLDTGLPTSCSSTATSLVPTLRLRLLLQYSFLPCRLTDLPTLL